ncbi:hypothetical protein [Brevundimonas sp.]|nr:hypothetical protein [Brevundimonas sp.]
MTLQSFIVLGGVIAAFAAFIVSVGGIAIWSNLDSREPGAGE